MERVTSDTGDSETFLWMSGDICCAYRRPCPPKVTDEDTEHWQIRKNIYLDYTGYPGYISPKKVLGDSKTGILH